MEASASNESLVNEEKLKYQQKQQEMRASIGEAERVNEALTLKLHQAKKIIERLRIERRILYEKLAKSPSAAAIVNGNAAPQTQAQAQPLATLQVPVHSGSLISQPSSAAILAPTPTAVSTSVVAGVKRKKRTRDPKVPKKPVTAFSHFTALERDTYKVSHPGISRGDLTKFLGAAWKELGDEPKKRYNEMFEQDKKRYAEEMEKYEASGANAGATDDGNDHDVDSDFEGGNAMDLSSTNVSQ